MYCGRSSRACQVLGIHTSSKDMAAKPDNPWGEYLWLYEWHAHVGEAVGDDGALGLEVGLVIRHEGIHESGVLE